MEAQRNPDYAKRAATTSIDAGAVDNLRYIRSTIEAARTFTAVPGKGCVAMGLVALVAAGLEAVPVLSSYWLAIWFSAAVVAGAIALAFMEVKARKQGLSLRRAVARRFFMTLTPALLAGAILTAALAHSVGRDAISGIWLLLYGAGVAACGVFSIPAVLTAGFAFMAAGTLALLLPPGAAPAVLAAGFGGIHLLLGAVIIRNHGG